MLRGNRMWLLLCSIWVLVVFGADAPLDSPKGEKSESGEEGSPEVVDGTTIRDTFSPEETDKLAVDAESFPFQAEVSRLMDIIINSLYTQKHVFLRELISNSADALEKARFSAVTDPSYLGEVTDLSIRIEVDKDAQTVTVQDTGIGMTREDLINNLGTVARSGTTNFLEALAESGDVNLIGQFGVGFYSAFLVADKVTVTSKHNNDPEQHIWESKIGGSFTVTPDPRGNTLKRGTRITLHLKEDSIEFLSETTIEQTIMRFNQFVNYPVYLRKTVEKEVVEEDSRPAEDIVDPSGSEDDEGKPKPPKPKETAKTHKVMIQNWQQLNTNKPIWLRPKDSIAEEEYEGFYESLNRDNKPLTYAHFFGEGEIDFRSIIYIPSKPLANYYDYLRNTISNIKLYSRRVLVTEGIENFVPKWLNFIVGVVDSDDLPLKVDRENLSQNRVLKVVGNKVTAKAIELLRKLSKDEEEEMKKYEEELGEKNPEDSDAPEQPRTKFRLFWKSFQKYIKIGCIEDDINVAKISKLLRFTSTTTGENKWTTLDAYVKRMPEGQEDVFYIAKDKFKQALSSPHMRIYEQKGYEVLVLTDALDEPCFGHMRTLDGRAIVNIEKSDARLMTTDEEKKYQNKVAKVFGPLTKAWSTVLASNVASVRVSHNIVDDPAAITVKSFAQSAFGDRVARSQTFAEEARAAPSSRSRHLDINPDHPLIKKMLEIAKTGSGDDPVLESMGKLLFETAQLNSGFLIEDPSPLARKVFNMLLLDAGVDSHAQPSRYELTEQDEIEYGEDEGTDAEDKDSQLNAHNIDFGDFDAEKFQEVVREAMEKKQGPDDVVDEADVKEEL